MLNTLRTGSANGRPPLLIVHGLYGSARNWGVIAKRLSDEREVLTVDMRNHGESAHFPTHSYADLADDLAEVIAANGGQADVVGHSMGGKASMVLALEHPEMVNRLVVADIAPVAYSHTQVQYIHAMRGLDLSAISTRGDADRALKVSVPEDGIRAFLLQSLDVKGKRWRLNLDTLEAEMSKIVGFPEVTGQFTGPTLFLSGAESDYVLPAHRETVKAHFPKARFSRIPGAGHWLHAEKPREFEATLRVFLNA
ncbi:alpha/beta fold hydrolase [Pseudoruegeria sp. SHC-113]|uniref:alpha/beta fold hydrolase n=1 Tax=Pseudoruegeria sp. SHC-113 TaxID=2855439 RepID=UPI0021BAF675|nr:alpha/beta fold hydrolase [Pseudoruegeria sp. SHC-113]MCT8159075.1 alpha/beta fold hydrolase [Pseudoruegeria sp. SHC-113]